MMKSLILIAVLASAFAVCTDAAPIQTEPLATHGVVTKGDKLLIKGEAMMVAAPTGSQSMTVHYHLGEHITINSIKIWEQGVPQGGHSFIEGLGTNHVAVKLTSAEGKGFNYIIELWGRE